MLGPLLLLLLLLARDRFALLARGPLRNDGVETASKGLLAHLSLLATVLTFRLISRLLKQQDAR